MKKNFLIRLILIFALLISGILIFKAVTARFTKPKASVTKNTYALPYLNLNFSFHPSTVQKFDWVTKDKKITFEREKADFKFIQEHLNLISIIHAKRIEKISELGSPPILFKVSFIDGHSWEGAWNGELVYWTSGPSKGFGTELSEAHKLIFLTGAKLKDALSYNLCSKKIVSIEFADTKQKITEVSGKWVFSRGAEVITQRVESWLSNICQLKIDHWVDANLLEVKSSVPVFSFNQGTTNFIRIEHLTIDKLKSPVFKLSQPGQKDLLFTSEQLTKEILNIPRPN